MQRLTVIHINGPINSGKSTIAAALARALPHAEFIEGDDHGLSDQIPPETRWSMALDRIEQCIHDTGCEHLVVAYPIDESGFSRLDAACKSRSARLVVVTLAPPVETALSDRGERRLTAWERNRIVNMYASGYQSHSFSDIFIDTSQFAVSECVDRILQQI